MEEDLFLSDLTGICRAAFGASWMGKSDDNIERLRQISWIPKELLQLYETIGKESNLLFDYYKGGFYPAAKIEMEPRGDSKNARWNPYLIYYQSAKDAYWGRYSYSDSHPPKNNGIFVWHNSIDGWKQVYGYESTHTLGTVLLNQVAEQLIAQMDHCIWVKVSLAKSQEDWPYLTAAKRLGMTPFKSISYFHYAYAYDIERQLLMIYDDDSSKRCLVYGSSLSELEKLGQEFSIEWQQRDGKMILNPKTFIQSTPPSSYEEKLDMMSIVLLGKRSMALPLSEIEKAEKRLETVFPDALKAFYLRFGKGGKLFCKESLNLIYTPKELEYSSDSKHIILAQENQGLWQWCLHKETGQIDLDLGDGNWDDWEMDLEDTLLWLLAMQAVGFFPHGGECLLEQDEEDIELISHFFHFLTKEKFDVFVNPERRIIGCRDVDGLYIMASKESEIVRLEEITNIEVSVF